MSSGYGNPPPPPQDPGPPPPSQPGQPVPDQPVQRGPSGPPAYSGGKPGPSGPRASFGERLIAYLIDQILVTIPAVVIAALLGMEIRTGSSGLVGTILGLAYYIYLEGSPSGQTVGKKVMNIRVVDMNTGGKIDYGRAAIRYLARILSGIVCLLGYLWMLWDREKQTWHDKLSTTVVVPTSSYPVESWPG